MAGYRVISYFGGDDVPVFLLNVFAKGDKVNLSKAERNELKKIWPRLRISIGKERGEMSKAGERILKSARAARAYARGEVTEGFVAHVPDDIDVRAVRKKLHLTREAFAQRFGLSVDAVKEWEMGRRKPERATRVLLKVIDREPEAVKRALEIA